jgi:hypothetical protein
MFPPEEVKPNETVKFGSCSTTLFSGTRASVTFTVDGLELEKDLWFRWEFVSFGVYRSSIPNLFIRKYWLTDLFLAMKSQESIQKDSGPQTGAVRRSSSIYG